MQSKRCARQRANCGGLRGPESARSPVTDRSSAPHGVPRQGRPRLVLW
jgi:hypothetical protein